MRQNEWVGKRAAVRQNCQMRAEMRFLDGRKPLECTVVDISATGCRIELPNEDDVPEDFDLFIPSRSETKIAKVRRQAGVNLGVAFLKSRLDDPLVMQTLLERVARLERGYIELKGAPRVEDEERRDGPGRRTDDGQQLDVPLIEHRLKALYDEMQELRASQEKMALIYGAAPDPEAEKNAAAQTAAEIEALKVEMAALGRSMRGLTSDVAGESGDYAADIAAMKGEMTKLSVALRGLSAEMPKLAGAGAGASAMSAEAAGQLTMQMARMKAEIMQLRASVETQQGGADTAAVAMARMEDVVALRAEVAQLRDDVAPTLRSEAVAATIGQRARIVETEVSGLKAEMERLHQAMQDFARDAATQADAALAERLDTSLGQLRDSVARDLANMGARIDELTQLRTASGSGPASPEDVVAEVSALKREMATLAQSLREVTSQAYAAAPNFSADLAHMKAEMLQLSHAMQKMASDLPKIHLLAPSMGDAERLSKLGAEMTELRQSLALEFDDMRARIDGLTRGDVTAGGEKVIDRDIVAEVSGMKREMADLAASLREVTSHAYAASPSFSADLAHMKAEMLKLSHSMQQMAGELPKIQLLAPNMEDAEKLSTINAEMDKLRAEFARLQPGTAPAHAVAPAASQSEEIGELRDSVRALILLVSRAMNQPRAAA